MFMDFYVKRPSILLGVYVEEGFLDCTVTMVNFGRSCRAVCQMAALSPTSVGGIA
jgi:hypothetical protein